MDNLREKIKRLYVKVTEAFNRKDLIEPLRRIKDSINISKIHTYIGNMKNQENFSVLKRAAAICIIGVMLSGGVLYYYNIKSQGYAVMYNGRLLGYIKEKEQAVQAFENLKEELKKQDSSIVVSSELSFEKSKMDPDKQISWDDVEKQVKSELYREFTAYSVKVNDKDMVYVSSEDEAKNVVEEVKKYFADKEAKNGAEVLDVSIKDDIQIESKIVDTSKVVDMQAAIDTLTGTSSATEQYIVKQGDSLWTIARNNGMQVEDIAAVNPGIDIELLQLGQAINLTANNPNVNVEVTYKMESEERVPFDTQYTTDSNLYKGQSKVVQGGQSGIKKVVNKITKLNGVEIAKSLVASSIVKNPVAQIVARGTKNLIGSGSFLWPTRGNITSGFGSRWGSYHKGLDIAAPKGTPVYAADGGTVTYAGWSGGFGNLVIIAHGNGYETYYGHNSKIYVKQGQSVKRGQTIAAVGSTGDSTGNHVHFEVRLNGVPKNPRNYLR